MRPKRKRGFVPATTRVKPSRTHNIDTDRLIRRFVFLVSNRREIIAKIDGRNALGHHAEELIAIQRELAKRGYSRLSTRKEVTQ